MWQKAANNAVRKALSIMSALPPVRLSAWAEQYFYLSKESSYVEGAWKAYPYQTFILDIFGYEEVEEITVKKASRTGYTKMILAASAYFSVACKRNQAIWQPTDGDAEEFVTTEYDAMLRDVKPVRKLFPAFEKKHKHNTNSFKKLIGSSIYIKGGSTARNYRRISVDVAIQDEIDSFDKDIDKEGSPKKLAKKRTEGATFPKHIIGSTPRLKYLSEVEASIETSEAVYQYHVPCPHCAQKQPLEFGGENLSYGLKWVNKDPSTVAYACRYCHSLFTQADYLNIWDKGQWIDQRGNYYDNATGKLYAPDGTHIQLQASIGIDNLWTIYSPQATWTQIVKEFLDATAKAKHGDKSELKTFINTTLGQTYEAEVEKTETSDLRKRAEDFPLQVVQRGGLIILASVDVQKDRFEFFAWVFGRSEETWSLDYQVIAANPAIYSEWDKLDAYLLKTYPHQAGGRLTIEDVAIDTGGHWTHQAYSYVRNRKYSNGWTMPTQGRPPKVYATKGSSKLDEKISSKFSLQDVNTVNNTLMKNGIKLYMIGTNKAKDLFHDRLQLDNPGPGYVHLSKYLPDDVFEHLTSEVRVVSRGARGEVSVWKKKREGIRNECLDCAVMVIFLARHKKLDTKSQKEWDSLERIIQPIYGDIFDISEQHLEVPDEIINVDISHVSKLIINHKQYDKSIFIPD